MLPVTRRGSSSRFIGRAEQLALFDEVVADLIDGNGEAGGEVLLVAGEAGVGKSRLADEWTARARSAGVLVLRGWCVEHGDDVMPLAPIADVLRDVATSPDHTDDVADVSGLVIAFDRPNELSSTDAAPSMVTLCDGLLRILYRLSARGPLAIVLEDMHWSDPSTRRVLMFLAPRLSHHRIALVMTYRSDELNRRHPLRPFLSSLRRAVRPEQIDLPPFSRPELTELIAAINGAVPAPRLVDRLHVRCAGNAFFAEELLADESSGRSSTVLRDVVLARTAGLDEDAMNALRAVAIAGARVPVEVLAAASGLAANRFADAVEAVTAAGLCVQDQDRISFRHELAREIVDDEILAGDRPGVHAALASAMEAITPHHRGEIARHWWLAGDRAAALRASVAAARAATEIAADTEALAQFERALELWELVPDPLAQAGCGRVDLLMDAADAAGRARLFGRALALGRRAVAEAPITDPRAEVAACVRLLPWAWFGTDDDDVGRLLDHVSRLERDHSNGWEAAVLAWRAMLTLSSHQHDRAGADAARPLAVRAIDLARATGQARAEVTAELTLGVCTCVEGKPEGLKEIRAALEKARAGGFAMETGRAYDNLAYYLYEFRYHDDVIDLEPEAMDYCAAAGIARVQGVMIQTRVIRALHVQGRWRDVESRVDALLAEFGTLDIEHLTLADSWGLILVRQGRLDGVHDLVDSALSRIGDHLSVLAPTAVTVIELMAAEGAVDGIPDLVDSTLARVLPRFAESGAALVASAIRALVDSAPRSAARSPADGRLARKRRADGWLDLVGRSDPPAVPPWMAIAEAERALLDDGTAEARWRAAVAAWRDLGTPYENAYTHYRLAETLLTGAERQAAATRAEARAMLTGARSIADELDAAPLRDRIDGLAARAHLPLQLNSTVSERAGGKDELGLTERETEVLRLVAQGYSNGQIGQALFISRKTASVHVSNILRKLGVSNRVEAATRSIR